MPRRLLALLVLMVLNHAAFKGSKVLISLFAIELGARPFAIGVMFAAYSFFPVFLSVYAGRVSDRLGARLPMIAGSAGLAGGLALPYFLPSLGALLASAMLIGTFYIFYTVSLQHLIGTFGDSSSRVRNYSNFSIFVGLCSLIGPAGTGFAIDTIGHRAAYLLLAALPLVPVLFFVMMPRLVDGHAVPRPGSARRHVGELVREKPLRRVLVTGGILETGNEVFNFLLPLYGHSTGLSASRIGLVMACYALALLAVRSAIPAMVRRSSEERVLAIAMLVAAGACLAYPFVGTFLLLGAVSFVLGLGLGCGAPLSMTLAYNRAPAGRSGEAIGLRQSVNKMAEVVVPLVFGVASTWFGMAPVFWLDAGMLALGGWLMHTDASRSRA